MTAREDEEFMNLGIQYYAAARSAVLAGLLPVFGYLYHHAIEAFLKARLSQKFALKQLKDEKQGGGHKLPLLWNSFKAEFPGTGLDQFDNTIVSIEQFEKLRYPDAIIAKGGGAQIIASWNASSSPTGRISGTTAPRPRYEIVVTDTDRLVAKIFEVCLRDPKFFTNGMNAYARDAITRDNPVAEHLVGLEH
jgi:hypothetical protein